MSWRHIGLLLIVNLAWATNTIVSKFVLSTLGVAPLFYTSLRFGLVAIGLLPWLRPIPARFRLLLLVGFLIGGLNFGLFFTGLRTSEASSATIVGQIGIPITLILSILILGERIDRRRVYGILLTVLGSGIVAWDPARFVISFGLIFVAASALSLALGTVLLKLLPDVKPLQIQAWGAVVSAIPLGLASVMFEPAQAAGAVHSGWILLAAAGYSAGVGSIVGYTIYYILLQKYEANILVPLTLVTPLITIAFGIVLFGETLDLRKAAGSSLAMAGVLTIAMRKSPAPQAALVSVRGT